MYCRQNKKLFAKMVSSFNNMCKGLSVECDEVITLLEQDEIVDFTKMFFCSRF